MKISRGKSNRISPNNTEELGTWGTTELQHTPYWPLLRVIADALDTSASGVNTYVVVGTTTDLSAVCVTVKQGTDKESDYGDDLVLAAKKLERLLDAL